MMTEALVMDWGLVGFGSERARRKEVEIRRMRRLCLRCLSWRSLSMSLKEEQVVKLRWRGVVGEETHGVLKAITSAGSYPSKHLFDSLIRFLSSFDDKHSLKRAFAALVYVIERKVELAEEGLVRVLLDGLNAAGSSNAVFAFVKCMFRNRVFLPFGVWGDALIDASRKSGDSAAFLGLFEESCKIGLDEGLRFVMPDLGACNAALEGCCRELESVGGAERIVELMAMMNVRPDEVSFGWLGYLYTLKGMDEKVAELETLMGGLGFLDRRLFFSKLVNGFVKAKNLECVTAVMLRGLRECGGEGGIFGDETFTEVVNGFVKEKRVKELSTLIIKAQELEPESLSAEISRGLMDFVVALIVCTL